MYYLTVESHFDSAHYLRGYSGQCANLHGHGFRYKVTLRGEKLNSLGMLIDFKVIKQIMKDEVETRFDHKVLNEIQIFDLINPTAENLARVIFELVDSTLRMIERVEVTEISVYESPECCATYKP